MDVGCGYGEFINNVACQSRFGMDLNARVRDYLQPDITFLEQDCSSLWPLPDNSLDLVFSSNFFEHLSSKQVLADTIAQIYRCLKPGGRMVAMGPNIRFVGGAYWDFWDHHLALTDSSLAEALRTQDLQIERVVDRFLPYTMVNRRPVPPMLVSMYLKMPFLWKIFGKQFLVFARKPIAGAPSP
jgi:SAM-dependent methyltransferase